MLISRQKEFDGVITVNVKNLISIIPLTTTAAVGFDCFGHWDSVSAEYRAGLKAAIVLLLLEGYTKVYLRAADGRTYKGTQQRACDSWKVGLEHELEMEIQAGQVVSIECDSSTSSRTMLTNMLRWMMGHPDDLKEAHCYWFTDQVRRNTRAHQLSKAIAKVKFHPSNRRVNGLRRPDKSWKSTWWAQLVYRWLPVK